MHKTIINLLEIKNDIKQFKTNVNDQVELIAVSKTFAAEQILPLIDFGHIHFGENKIQEALNKWPTLKSNHPSVKLHMLGKIQTNKVKYLLPLFDYIHSLDNYRLAEKIADQEEKKGKKFSIFIQVNLGQENQKNGVMAEDLEKFYSQCSSQFNLNIIGLMCLPPIKDEPTKYFLKLQNLAKNLGIPNLSMGMSNDYKKAIKSGSTFIRVGSRLFGSRN